MVTYILAIISISLLLIMVAAILNENFYRKSKRASQSKKFNYGDIVYPRDGSSMLPAISNKLRIWCSGCKSVTSFKPVRVVRVEGNMLGCEFLEPPTHEEVFKDKHGLYDALTWIFDRDDRWIWPLTEHGFWLDSRHVSSTPMYHSDSMCLMNQLSNSYFESFDPFDEEDGHWKMQQDEKDLV